MSDQSPLVISTANTVFTFASFEVPEEMKSLGGFQMHAMHQYIGGRRTLTPLGPAPHEVISWSGKLSGPNSFLRGQQLDTIRQSGLPATLTYASWRYVGLLTKVWIEPGHEGWCSYHLEFVPSEDLSLQTVATPDLNPDAQFADSQSAFAALNAQLSTTPSLAGMIQTKLAMAASVLTAVQQAYQTIQSNGGSIQNVAASAFAAQVTVLNAALVVFPLTDVVPPIVGNAVAGLNAVTYAGAQLLWEQQFVQQVETMLFLLSQPPAQITYVTVTDPCLAAIASQQYGNADDWPQISQANNNFPFFALGTYTLVIPNPS